MPDDNREEVRNLDIGVDNNLQAALQLTVSQRTLSPVLAFVGNIIGGNLCVSILSMARADMYENSLAYGKRKLWFKTKMVILFAPVFLLVWAQLSWV